MLAPAPVAAAYERAEAHPPGRVVEHEVAVLLARLREVRRLRPVERLIAADDLDGVRLVPAQHGRVSQLEALVRLPVSLAQHLALDRVGVARGDGRGNRLRLDPPDRGRAVVALALAPHVAHAHPRGLDAVHLGRDGVRGDVEVDVARAVEAEGRVDRARLARTAGAAVVEQQERCPVAAVVGPVLPAQGRVARVDVRRGVAAAVQPQLQAVAREVPGVADVEGVALLRLLVEDRRLDPARADVREVVLEAGALAPGPQRLEVGRRDGERLDRGEDERLVGLRAIRGYLRPRRHGDGAGQRRGEVTGDVDLGRHRRIAADADEFEEALVHLLRHAVELVEGHLRHPGEQLDEGDARIADVVVGPLGAVARDQASRLVDDVLELAQVERSVGRARHLIPRRSCRRGRRASARLSWHAPRRRR